MKARILMFLFFISILLVAIGISNEIIWLWATGSFAGGFLSGEIGGMIDENLKP